MSTESTPLIETFIPDRLVGWSMEFIGAGYTGLLVKNGRLVRTLLPGRHFTFALPLLEESELMLVDTKIRNLDIVSQGDFLSKDQYLINVSLNVMYQVVDPKRVALELSEPIAALISAVKDTLGLAIGQLSVEQLIAQGRAHIRRSILENTEVSYSLGFSLEDVRVNDISFPQGTGIIRQVEGMSARQQAEHQAALQAQIAQAGRPDIISPPGQQINIFSGQKPNSIDPAINAILEGKNAAIEGQAYTQPSLPTRDSYTLPPTVIDPHSKPDPIARLVNNSSGAIAILSNSPFTIGREPVNTLVLDDNLSSRHHAQILKVIDKGTTKYELIDLGSSNGTFVDGQRLVPKQPVSLNPGNIIKIGSQIWTFEVDHQKS
ncbi:FHA domain-containing protein [Aetokthonos hydrillicola Thurmond2011]|jgi:regulator of protease activity HflC (stomatin/prohibitin superfamily)|uniref:FHA domain-containing protein n=1 Tax=Aetokthonos hydrillicola Thurmond2011 TaxID=2712845 RepID=A0AAP5I6A2_9CYAN|nr:SPFH domain-containing protein [Aetokthonos hydrillicola]MBO3461383.1 FHA domain-containing protein [Aetokthonos hydrillicola CCALA 1050]MBW4586819.1 FHA domain-containing protein [Aetokthonos hydrillicola CCALA 1050]MDR9895823.1 FHA domain-containing protein [Aetokthonos hydrillicola Thurmond2011]